jgi:hypothetical protein
VIVALIAALLLTGFFVAALTIPVDLSAHACVDDDLEARLKVEWLYGWLRRDITPSRTNDEKRGGRPTRAQLALLFEEPFRNRVEQLLHRLRRWISIEQLSGRLRFGLLDPADTGMALGWAYPLLAVAESRPEIEIELLPYFGGERLDGHLEGRVRAVPLGVLVAGLGFVLTPEAFRTVRRWRSLRG